METRTMLAAQEAHPSVAADAADAPREKEALLLFAFARAKRLTGTFELARPNEDLAATVVVERGSVSKIRTTAPIAFLSTVLLELGYLEAGALMTSLVELGKRERLHGQILVDGGQISTAQLQKGLHEQTTRKLEYVLSLGLLSFHFHEEQNLLAAYGGSELVRIDPLASIWRTIRVAAPEAHVRASLARVTDLRCKLAATEQVARFRFTGEELELVESLRGRDMTLGELKDLQLLSPRETELLFYALLITKQLEGAGPAAPPAIAKPDAPPSTRKERWTWTLSGISAALAQEQLSSPPPPPSSRPSAPVSRHSSGSMPAVRPPPARHSSGSMPAARPSSAQPPASSSPPASHTYAIAGSRPAPSMAEDPPTLPKGPPLPLVRAQEIFERARAILRQDYFERLGLSVEASQEAVDAAFHDEARVWGGPVPPEVDGAQEAQDTVLTALVEAHDVLGDRDLRDVYTKGLIHGRGGARAT